MIKTFGFQSIFLRIETKTNSCGISKNSISGMPERLLSVVYGKFFRERGCEPLKWFTLRSPSHGPKVFSKLTFKSKVLGFLEHLIVA